MVSRERLDDVVLATGPPGSSCVPPSTVTMRWFPRWFWIVPSPTSTSLTGTAMGSRTLVMAGVRSTQKLPMPRSGPSVAWYSVRRESCSTCVYIGSYCGHMQIGVRELKQRLSEFIALAGSGQTVEITDRGVPKALLVPLPVRDAFAAGIAEGWLRPGRASGLRAHVGRPSPHRVLDVLDDDRGAVDE